jgi:hypothetical protein
MISDFKYALRTLAKTPGAPGAPRFTRCSDSNAARGVIVSMIFESKLDSGCIFFQRRFDESLLAFFFEYSWRCGVSHELKKLLCLFVS